MGSAYALERGDIFTPLIRNLGAIFVRGGRPRDVFAPVHGQGHRPHPRPRPERALRLALRGRAACPPSSPCSATWSPSSSGAVMAERMKGRPTVALTWIGDGATSTGAFHEGFNFACVQKVPLVVIVENNKFAYSTPTSKQTANPVFVDRAQSYGCFGEQVDGNDVLAVYEVTRRAIERARQRSRPDPHRGRHHAHARPRRARRHEIRPPGTSSRSGPGKTRSRDTSGTSSTRASPPPTSSPPSRPVSKPLLAEDLAWAEASPFPDPASGLSGRLRRPPVEPPTPPLVREWERRKR